MGMKLVSTLVVVASLITSSACAGDWWESVSVKGDLRYRHEMIDTEDNDARHRHRVRARVAVTGQVNSNTKAVVQIATGSDDPVSTNQTLGDGFSSKSVVLDLAYFEMTHPELPGLKVTGGKFNNPFYKPGKSELLWDSDFNPEGGVATFSRDFENVSVDLIGSGLYIEERSSDGDSWIGAGQGALTYHFNDEKTSIAAGGGFFHYENAEGMMPFWDGEPMGNSVDTLVGHYVNGYDLIELFAEFTHEFENIPVTVMGDFVTNSSADSLNAGWLAGARVGAAKKPGSWEFHYNYREVKKDAVVGTFTDSDFRGGGTDARGHEIGGALQVMKNAAVHATYFINEIGLEDENTKDFKRLQLDLQLKF